ncbi:MAG: hypothetical protein OEZ41_09780, partial [Nitrospirota bacterium]|nr:hypothetical protein [Nitrospirota bacterium]
IIGRDLICHMKKFIWDTSAIIDIKKWDGDMNSRSYCLIKDLSDGFIPGPYRNIFPALAVFEVNATVSRMHRDGEKILREFYLMDENALLYDINQDFVYKSNDLFARKGFDMLRGADLVIACIAFIESGYLVTLDKGFKRHVSEDVKVIDLNDRFEDSDYFKEIVEAKT